MDKRFETGILLAEKAGSLLGKERENPGMIENLDYDVKLSQDRDSEKIILSGIEELFPDDGFLSEERGGKKGLSGYTWTVDPLDGTFNYSRGIPHCCVSIACRKDSEAFGIVYDFFRGEIFTAATGKGAFLNGKAIRTSRTKRLKEAVICFGLMKNLRDISSGIAAFSELALKVKKVRMLGAAALDLCYVASGRTDFFMETGLKAWDTAAGSLIVEEAGGTYREYPSDNSLLHCAGNGSLETEDLCKKLAGT